MRHPSMLVKGAKMAINMLECEGLMDQLNSRGDLLLLLKAQICKILVSEYQTAAFCNHESQFI